MFVWVFGDIIPAVSGNCRWNSTSKHFLGQQVEYILRNLIVDRRQTTDWLHTLFSPIPNSLSIERVKKKVICGEHLLWLQAYLGMVVSHRCTWPWADFGMVVGHGCTWLMVDVADVKLSLHSELHVNHMQTKDTMRLNKSTWTLSSSSHCKS